MCADVSMGSGRECVRAVEVEVMGVKDVDVWMCLVYVCMRVCVYVCVNVCMCVCVYAYCVCAYVCICVCVCAHMCVLCICVYMCGVDVWMRNVDVVEAVEAVEAVDAVDAVDAVGDICVDICLIYLFSLLQIHITI